MAVSNVELDRPPAQTVVSQFGLGTILIMFAWPAIWYSTLIYLFGRPFIPEAGTAPTWFVMAVIALGGGAEMLAALVLLRREGYRLTVAVLRDRIRLRWPRGGRNWAIGVGVLVLGLALSVVLEPFNGMLATVPGFVPPVWWPAGSNPTVEVNSVADVFFDVDLVGNYLFAAVYFVIGLVFNIIGEELYYRGYLLPRMRGVFGRWDWVANGVLFTLKHVYQRWLYPGIVVGSLCFAFAAGPLGSLPLATVYHWIGNYLLQMIFLIQAAMGG